MKIIHRKVIELILYTLHYNGDQTYLIVDLKFHPHDTHSIVEWHLNQ